MRWSFLELSWSDLDPSLTIKQSYIYVEKKLHITHSNQSSVFTSKVCVNDLAEATDVLKILEIGHVKEEKHINLFSNENMKSLSKQD